MKQIIQNLKDGITSLEEVPVPIVKTGCLLIKTRRTLVSLGTERMLVEFGKASLIEKARQQPDKVKQVLDKIRTDGMLPTLEAVFNKLGQPLPLGYCNVGTVVEVGKGVTEFKIGDRVASNGNHAEYVCVPKNLCAKIPDGVSDNEAAFTVIGSIALQGIRNINPQLGETIVVVGLGLIGLIAIQLLRANGCRVIGSDYDQSKVDLARKLGINSVNPAIDGDIVNYIMNETEDIGADGVLITASSKSDDIIHQACQMCRKRGRIVLVGVIGLNLQRDDFYKKELTFQVSCSYGAGRYDEEYENKGIDYPLAYVRWTEKRNFETILQTIETKRIDVLSLITESVPLEDYGAIYGDMRKKGSIASIIEYSNETPIIRKVKANEHFISSGGRIAIVGAGNFASATLVPALQKAKADIKYISSAHGLTAKILARKAGAEFATSDTNEIFKDKEVKTVIICTRHNLHANFVVEALKAEKSVFVEKPLCLSKEQLLQIQQEYEKHPNCMLTVGFNRRFSPFAEKMKQLSGACPKHIVANMNAGFIPSDSWVQDLDVGGGRIIGEACHFIDLCSYIADSKVIAVCMNALGVEAQENTDNVSILLKFENGSNAVVNYFSNGSKEYSKERIEVFASNSVLVLDNWRVLRGYGIKGFSCMKSRMNKGHEQQFKLLTDRTEHGGDSLISFDSIKNTTLASFAAIQSLKEKRWIEIND